ncbi:MAG: PadR family transcriptional regulator [Candidatus Micrarchaeota archaeon]
MRKLGKKDEYESHCDMRGMLSFLVLFLLSKKSMHGQELADEIGKRKGAKPSPGTIYPALKALKAGGLIKENRKGKTISYSLTADGKRALKYAKAHFCRTFMGIY